METNRKIIFAILFLLIPLLSTGQNDSIKKEAYIFKLDYNVPESPAFSILDANPTTVMRGNAAQEVIVNLASSFVGNGSTSPGLALDFNPFFVFGGRLNNIDDYKENISKRLLANTQVSIATIDSKIFPNDMLFSGGIRITLFDTKDIIFDSVLASEIDKALITDIPTPIPGQPIINMQHVDNKLLAEAYSRAKKRYQESKGGSTSVGYAVAGKALNNSFKTDSISTFRHQAWIVGQYDLGKLSMSVNGMLMYRYEKGLTNELDKNGIISGISLKHYGNKLILSGEIYFDGIKDEIGFGGYIEAYVLPNISIYASLSKDETKRSSSYHFKPGIKYNLSETKK